MAKFRGIETAKSRTKEAAKVLADAGTIKTIESAKIIDSDLNEGLPLTDLESLADSMRGPDGMLEPICVYDKGDGTYELFSGHRRRKAWCEILGHKSIACVVYPYPENEVIRFRDHASANTETREKDVDYWLPMIKNARKLLKKDNVKRTKDEELDAVVKLLNPTGKEKGISKMQVRRYEGYDKLIPELKALHGDYGLSANTLYAASSLTPKLSVEEQQLLAKKIDKYYKENGDRADMTRALFSTYLAKLRNEKTMAMKIPFDKHILQAEATVAKYLARAQSEEEKKSVRVMIASLRNKFDEWESTN